MTMGMKCSDWNEEVLLHTLLQASYALSAAVEAETQSGQQLAAMLRDH